MTSTPERALRADAQRNRDRLLKVAVQAFSGSGSEITLDAIARQAGVGIGTLYRHFPTRDALVEAAYRSELARLCDGVDGLLTTMPADAATRAWMHNFVDYMATKRGMADALRAVIAQGGNPYEHSRGRLLAAINRLLRAGADDGTLRPGVEPGDVLAALSGVSLTSGQPDQHEQPAGCSTCSWTACATGPG
jgi:AcrR family transcriptional regulator